MHFPTLLSRAVRLRNFKAAWIGGLAGVVLTVLTGFVLSRSVGDVLGMLIQPGMPAPSQWPCGPAAWGGAIVGEEARG